MAMNGRYGAPGLRVSFSLPTQPYQRYTEPEMTSGGAALLRAGQQVGDAVGAVASVVDKIRQQDERLLAAKMRAEDRTHWNERFIKAKEEAPVGAPDFTAGFLKDFDAYAAERLKAAPSPDARREIELGLVGLRGDLTEQSMQFEAGSRLAKRRADVEEIRNLNGALVSRDHTRFAPILDETVNAISALGLPPQVQAQEIEQTRKSMAEAALLGLANRDPAAAMVAIKSGAWDGYTAPERLVRLQEHAQVEDRRRRAEARQMEAERRAEERSILEPMVRDAHAAYLDGKPYAPISENRLVGAYGPERGRQLFQDLEATRKLGADVKSVALLPPTLQDELLKRYEPDGEGYAGERERYVQLGRAIAQDRKNREDPAAYVLSHSPRLRDLVAGIGQNPENAPAAIALSLQLQKDAGIPEVDQRILPRAMAERSVREIAAMPDEARANALEAMATAYGEHWPRVYGELVAEKLPVGAMVLPTVEHPVARKELAAAQAIGRAPLKQALEATGKKGKEVEDGVRSAMQPFAESLSVQPGGPAKAAMWQDQMELLAYKYALTMPAADAAKKAVDDIVLSKYDFVPQDGGLQVRAPKGQGDRIAAYARHVLDTLKPSDLLDAGGNEKLNSEDRLNIFLTAARRGIWVNNERDDGWVLLMDARGARVRRADGRRIEFRYGDVTDVATDRGRYLTPDQAETAARRSGLSADQVRENARRRRAAEEE